MIEQAEYLGCFEVLIPYKTKFTFARIWDKKKETGIREFW